MGAILVVTMVVLSLSSVAFSACVGASGTRYWVRGDAGFQRWLKQTVGRSILYGRQMLLVLTDERLELYLPHRVQPVWSIDYKSIVSVSTETFQSRSVPGTRAVRMTFESIPSLSLRPELLWVPSRFSPRTLVDDLARDLGGRARQAESAAGAL
jgi:hypothetical protein